MLFVMTATASSASSPPATLHSRSGPAIWDMDDAHCTLLVADTVYAHRCPVLHYLQPGLQLLSRRIFRQQPPQPKQIEQAILLVEDMLVPTARLLPAPTQLLCAHPLVHSIAAHAAIGEAHTTRPRHLLHLESTEALLQRRLAQDPELPREAPWTAALVLAYEVMAQWEIPNLQLVPAPALAQE